MLKLKDSGVSTSFARSAVVLTIGFLVLLVALLASIAHRFL